MGYGFQFKHIFCGWTECRPYITWCHFNMLLDLSETGRDGISLGISHESNFEGKFLNHDLVEQTF